MDILFYALIFCCVGYVIVIAYVLWTLFTGRI
jgi:hypothetical protein